jgi:aspartate/methionine/tyrosine aminotransferase
MPRTLSAAVRAMRPGVFAELQSHIDAAVARGTDLVPLHIGDTCMTPPPAGEVWTRPATLGTYGPTAALATLRQAFAERLARVGHGPPNVDGDRHVLVGAGATHALSCAARTVLSEGDDVLLLAPYWPLAHGIITAVGANVVEVPFTDRLYADAKLDVAAWLESHRTARTRAIYIITPNNPDGKVLTEGTLRAIAAFAERHDLWIFADEAYADWVYEGVHTSIAAVSGAAERTITAYTMSKSHALAGARVGCVVAPENVIAAARRVSVHTVFNVPVSMQEVALAAFRGEAGWADAAKARYRRAREVAEGALAGAGLSWHRPEGGAYLFVDFAPVLGEGGSLSRVLARAIDEGVLLTPGDAFGQAYATWARLCFTSVPEERLLEGIARLRRAIERSAR